MPVSSAALSAEQFPPPAPPNLDVQQQAYLLKLARQTILSKGRLRAAATRPELCKKLAEYRQSVGVFVRRAGLLIGEGYARRAPLPQAVRTAAGRAGRAKKALSGRQVGAWLSPDDLAGCRIEVEVFGLPQQIKGVIEAGGKISDLLGDLIEPGLDGLGAVHEGKTVWFPPSLAIATNAYSKAQADAAFDRADVPTWDLERFKDAAKLFRFRSLHILESRPAGPPLVLRRGVVVIRPEQVTLSSVNRAIDRIGRYMLQRQRRDGSFSYEYLPSGGIYRDDVRHDRNWDAQAGAAWAMSLLARWENRDRYQDAALRGIAALDRYRTPINQGRSGAFLKPPDGPALLGPTAVTALAIIDLPKLDAVARELLAGPLQQTRAELLTAVESALDAGGRFHIAFGGFAPKPDRQYTDPGLALTAMLKSYRRTRDQAVLDAVKRALGYYWELYRADLTPRCVPRFTQALCWAWRATGQERYAGQAFLMTDSLFSPEKVLGPKNCPFPELYGGVDAYRKGRAGADTPLYLEGLADVLEMAQDFLNQLQARLDRGQLDGPARARLLKAVQSQRTRCEHYRQVLRAGLRFTIQLQVRPEETYYMPVPQEAVWGIRSTLLQNNLRIDNCQHAVVALMKARRVLWPDWRDRHKSEDQASSGQ